MNDDEGSAARVHKKINKFEKQKQGEILTKFLIKMMKQKLSLDDNSACLEYLNSGSGVLDVAGGNGWASFSLALHGIKSTVIDPSPAVGCLPARYRKFLRRAIQGKYKSRNISDAGNSSEHEKQRHPNNIWYDFDPHVKPLMFDKLQAFFVSSYDVRGFVDVKVCEECSEDKILENCSCIIGLHPDQATGAIVEFAVKHRKPFIVVPCCVFSRLFPDRFVPSSGSQGRNKKVVSTKDELVEWCVGLDPHHIKVSQLPFQGSNIAVWSTFA